MSWENRQSDSTGDPIRDRNGPPNWPRAIRSGLLPLVTAGDIQVQVHASLIIVVALLLVLGPGVGFSRQDRIESVLVLVGILACREAARCAVAWRQSPGPVQLIIGPFGGPPRPRLGDRPLPMMWAIGFSLLVNALICGGAWVVVHIVDHTKTVDPLAIVRLDNFPGWSSAAYHARWIYAVGTMLLGLGLLPIFPLPMGRVAHAFLLSRVGFSQGTLLTSASGVVGSFALLLIGGSLHNWMIVAVAACCCAECMWLRLLLHRTLDALGDISEIESAIAVRRRRRLSRRKILRLRRRAQLDAMELRSVDAVLEKVSRRGLDGISWRERRILRRATQRHRELQDFEDAPVME